MVAAGPLAALGRLLSRGGAPSHEELASYASEVLPALFRSEELYQEWFQQPVLVTDKERLANVAAIHCWEAGTMHRSLNEVQPPSILARAHSELVVALLTASRAAQLLSNGSRFHNANAVCDGQNLLEESRERRLAAGRAIRRVLERHDIPWTGPSAPLEMAAADSSSTRESGTAQ